MDGYPTTRAEAKNLGAKHYFTGEPCKRGHVALRKAKGSCVECVKEDAQKVYESRKDYFAQYNRRADVRERRHEWYIAHRDEVAARAVTRPDEVKRRYRKVWKDNNPDKVRAHTKNRRRKHRQATPPWLSARQKDEMRQLYRIAVKMTKLTGEEYVVDHIFPLQSETSCGLHVPWNLRVITRKENAEKHNKIPEGRGYAFYPDWGKLGTSEGAA